MLRPLIPVLALCALAGCAGSAANSAGVAALKQAWPSVKEDAAAGIAAKQAAGTLTPAAATARQGRVTEFDTTLGTMK